MSRVLIVDDKDENRYYLESLLRAHGHQTESARHGGEALEKAREQAPDVVVSDLLMPVMDGYSLLRQWRIDPRLRRIPFIVYTATYTDPEDERLALDLGADAFILKPAEPEEFLAWLREVLSRAPVHGPPPPQPNRADETDLLRSYSETLIRKLEEKTLQLEEANRNLKQDIERREAAEVALRISEERFRLLARATNDAVWDWDLQGGSRWWGAGFTDLFGHESSGGEAAQGAWVELIHPQDRDRILDDLNRAIAEGHDTWSGTYRLRCADDRWVQAEDRGLLLRDGDGRPIRMVGGMSDVSARQELEERLRTSQRMEAVGQLTGGVAHDFNNLLTVVMGNAELLLTQFELQPRARSLVETTLSAAQRGADLTRRLLAFARRQPLSPRSVRALDLVSDIEPLLRSVLGEQTTLSVACDEQSLAVWADPVQLEQALLNLCANARDAMPQGGELRIGIERHPVDPSQADLLQIDSGDYAIMSIADTGSGIDKATLPRVFEPFFTTKRDGSGTGLGLAMVYGFVRQSGGQVLVESEAGVGTEFRLFLPLAPADCADAPEEPTARDEGNYTATASGNVLLVEDDESVRGLALAHLESLGYRVLEATNGSHALRLLQGSTRIDLLFSDIMMPDMRGPELARRARAILPGLRVLFTSGYAPDAIDIDGSPAATVSVLAKPYRREELARALRLAME